jgi:hypothetical protein
MFRIIPFLVVLLASCSHFHSKAPVDYEVQRALANTGSNQSCVQIIERLASRDIEFSERIFDERFKQLGLGHVLNLMDGFYRAQARNLDSNNLAHFDFTRMRLRNSTDTDIALRRLTDEDKFVIWNTALRQNDRQVEEFVFTQLAQEGDPAAAFLLRLPAGEARRNGKIALSLMKRIEPETPLEDLVRRLEARMLTCVR